MSKEIIITNANNQDKFISFRLNGLEDGILVGIPDKYPNCITISYKGETKVVPLDAKTEDLEELNSDENVARPSRLEVWQPDQVTELDEESFDKFAKEVYSKEVDAKKVEAAKQIFEGIENVPIDMSDFSKCELTYGKPHLLELMDSWGVNGTNYDDFRSVIQEHCFDKGLYAFDDIEKIWKSHIKSLKDVVKSMKEKNNV